MIRRFFERIFAFLEDLDARMEKGRVEREDEAERDALALRRRDLRDRIWECSRDQGELEDKKREYKEMLDALR